ncbi:hypothetical protein RSSM_05962 [Rhodopirellula sallentina SM41]|uniref:Uncharacterized protein n=1 Tax=Rhodopirellula sallentina SM41 TaxID=1263870 RepID=M5TTU1_9BACT|nr:hypothetical protein RSSM_05962 [Rhodopirellula sallentina SM41]
MTTNPTRNVGEGRFAVGGRRIIDGDAQYGQVVERTLAATDNTAPHD